MVAYRPLATKLYSQHKVRTSLHDRTLESMIPVLNPSRSDGDDVSKKTVGLRDIPESNCDLTSILELRKSVQKSVHHGLSHRPFEWDDGRLVYSTDLTEIIKKHTFVGIVDDYRCLSLIQHATKLYLLNHAAVAYVAFTVLRIRPESDTHVRSEEMFYQLALLQFGSYRRLKLDPPPPLRALLKLAVDAEPGTEKSGMSKNEIVDVCLAWYLEGISELTLDRSQRIAKTLLTRRGMLAEYFEINITSDGEIESLPHLMKEYTPDLNKLPAFLMRLGPQVGCFLPRIIPTADWNGYIRCNGSQRKNASPHSCASSHTFIPHLHRISYPRFLVTPIHKQRRQHGKSSMCCSRRCANFWLHPSRC